MRALRLMKALVTHYWTVMIVVACLALAAGRAMYGGDTVETGALALPWKSIVLKVGLMLIILEVILLYLRRLDRRMGVKFNAWLEIMAGSPDAISRYLSARFFTVGLIAAAVLFIA